MDGGALWATVHGVPKSCTQLGDFIFLSLSVFKVAGHLEFSELCAEHQHADVLLFITQIRKKFMSGQ